MPSLGALKGASRITHPKRTSSKKMKVIKTGPRGMILTWWIRCHLRLRATTPNQTPSQEHHASMTTRSSGAWVRERPTLAMTMPSSKTSTNFPSILKDTDRAFSARTIHSRRQLIPITEKMKISSQSKPAKETRRSASRWSTSTPTR